MLMTPLFYMLSEPPLAGVPTTSALLPCHCRPFTCNCPRLHLKCSPKLMAAHLSKADEVEYRREQRPCPSLDWISQSDRIHHRCTNNFKPELEMKKVF